MNKTLFYLFVALALFSCRNRNPNLTEKQLLALMYRAAKKNPVESLKYE